ncbi:MAG: response regulator, partial [Oligoflexia bacterium]|nr:response regulator [Oligoflexia bacterium]
APANGSAAERGRQVPALSIWIIDSDEADAAAMSLWLGSDPELREEGRLEIRRFRTVNEVAELAASGTPPGPPAAVVVEAGETGNGAPAIGELSELLRSDLRITAPLLAIGESLDAGMAFAHGARASLSKPLEEQRFLGALRGLLEGRRRRVLIVDADADLRLLIKRSLERRGFRADDLDRGEEALRRLRQESYDLLLLDLGLPDVSGEDFLRALHRLPSLERLPVFVMLGQDKAPPSRARLLSIGADQFVGKHGGIGGIVDAVHDFLETPLEAE